MYYVIGTTLAGTSLNNYGQKITDQHKNKALGALELIHSHGILHNDIRAENILIDDANHVNLIDFGMACYYYDYPYITKEKKQLFDKEKNDLYCILDEL